MTTQNSLLGVATLIAACCLTLCSASAQTPCPDGSPCVTSQTWLVNGDNNTMDAFTEATQDYGSAYYYGICINLAVLEVNPQSPYIRDWTVVVPSTTPSICNPSGFPEIGSDTIYGAVPWATFPTTPGTQYFAYGIAQLQSPTYEWYYGIAYNLWVDPENFSHALIYGGDTENDTYGITWTWPPLVGVTIVFGATVAMNSSGALAEAYAAAADKGTVQVTFTDTSQSTNPTRDVTKNTSVMNTVDVLVGQKITLSATVTPPQGANLTKQSWSNPTGTAISNYVVTYNTGPDGQRVSTQVVPLPGTPPQCPPGSSCSTTFYWVYANSPLVPGRETDMATFSYELSNGGGDNITVYFTVNGPVVTTSGLTASFGQAQMDPSYGGLTFGDKNGTAGATFSTNIQPPTGAGQNNFFQFVQLVTGDTRTQLPHNDLTHSNDNPQICTPSSTGLDSYYPYPFGTLTSAQDSPRLNLGAPSGGLPLAESLRDFAATMYLLWDPSLPNGCAPARTVLQNGIYVQKQTLCASIPVPLASLQWEFKECAIDTLTLGAGLGLNAQKNGTAWSVSCSQLNPKLNGGGKTATVLVLSGNNNYAYPLWNTWFLDRQTYNCP